MPQLVVKTRSGRIESTHDGFICVTDSDKNIRNCLGDPNTGVFLRSAGKPIYAVAVVNSGAMRKFDLSLKELAVICSSHSGQAFHRRIVKSILQKVGLSEKHLDCGHAQPENEKVKNALIKLGMRPSPVFNCCSGLHAGLLALCRYHDFPVEGYTDEGHPVQHLIKKLLADLLECEEKDVVSGRDGCTIQTYNLTLHQFSWLYARLARGYDARDKYKDCFGLIQNAMKKYPRLINGDGQFCTDLSWHSGGRVIGKLGAEGIYCVAIPERKLGVCVKISDGHPRASYSVVVRVLEELGILGQEAVKKMEKWAMPQVKDDKGNTVGYLHTAFSLLSGEGGRYLPGDTYPVVKE